ncbi:class I SAM-dependent methyltransferase [Peptoniphilus sp. MSJ-1]|uniref:Class I SAM-dependent methyltransferase n=1 Tax=Peptoniphilus ovalis TaxID=2841503 RepID=A0ABS6FIX9_9FIRM|nr:class I SAM-dependent methyltransferase [Peptoniphilus ovalis]MBU5669964.1 class I SAM-dependent methyltransferase [Peptoniphilus ovalis]
MIKLSKRLQKIASLVDLNSKVIDVGTDHGYVPNFLCEKNISRDVIATDISMNSLEKSIELTKKLNNDDKIRNILCDGIYNEYRDNIIIAGLGGIQIAEIIEKSIEISKVANKLILQPMQKNHILRRELYNMDFDIIDEEIVYEDNRYFEIIIAKYTGEKINYENSDIYISKAQIKKKNRVFLDSLIERKKNLKNIIENFNSSSNEALKRKEELIELYKKMEEAINEISN